jgi:hypothetical protein
LALITLYRVAAIAIHLVVTSNEEKFVGEPVRRLEIVALPEIPAHPVVNVK